MDSSVFSIGKVTAPQRDGELLTRPLLPEWDALARQNSQRLRTANVVIAGQSLGELRHETRLWVARECDDERAHWLGGAPVSFHADEAMPWIVTGHQPLLAHPGVWAKNIAAAAVAQRCQGAALNLIVDSDVSERSGIDVPAGTATEPRFDTALLDQPCLPQPWEELRTQDHSLISSFGERVSVNMARWGIDPEIRSIWPDVLSRQGDSNDVGRLLTLSRLQMEKKRGIENLELRLSRLSQSPTFLRFLWHLMHERQRYLDAHNQSVREYRRMNRIRSSRHPVPDLEQRGDWNELPFWIWKPGERHRQRLFVSSSGDRFELSAGTSVLASIRAGGFAEVAHSDLQQLLKHWKIRPRALTTTLFARLVVADLFVHGIGGAKYDEVTDRIIHRFFGISPPAFSLFTATMHLPLPAYDMTLEQLRIREHRERDLRFNPHAYLPGMQMDALVRKRDGILQERRREQAESLSKFERARLRQRARQRHQQLVQIRETLARQTEPQRQHLLADIAQARQQLAANRILRSREFAAVLFPETRLDRLVNDIRRLAIH